MKRHPQQATDRSYYHSPIGTLEILGTNGYIYSIMFRNDPPTASESTQAPTPDYINHCIHQLHDYFQGIRTDFDLPLTDTGTDFQKKVWSELRTIPFGETRTYSDLATTIGNPNSVRAVGNANGKNKLSIVVPCHRVIGSNGSLTGYAGEIWRKEWLLKHESGRQTKRSSQPAE